MKKNNMLRIASVLLVAVLLSTCAISGVFAKYQTIDEDPSEDTASVAKWGVVVSSDIANLFKAEYAKDDTNAAITFANSVSAGSDVVAPGTNGTILDAITITGTPDVAVEIKYEATVNVENWTVGGDFYCPLTIAGVSGLDYTSDTAFEAAVKAAIDKTLYVEAGKNLAEDANVADVEIGWEWAFEDNTPGAKQTIVKDTALGDAAVNGTAATVYVSVLTTVTQVD